MSKKLYLIYRWFGIFRHLSSAVQFMFLTLKRHSIPKQCVAQQLSTLVSNIHNIAGNTHIIKIFIKCDTSFLIVSSILHGSNQRCYKHNDTVLQSDEKRRFPRWHCGLTCCTAYFHSSCIYKHIN